MAELIRESSTLQQRLEETYDTTQICFTELEYCLAVPGLRNAKNAQGYYHQYWDAWKNFNLLFHLTYHESKVREKLGSKGDEEGEDFMRINNFFDDSLHGSDLSIKLSLSMIRMWKQYDRALRRSNIISLVA